MGIDIKNSILKFRCFMFTYWAMMLSVSGMFTMYIAQLGYNKKEISIAVTIHTVSALIGQNIFGYLLDKFRCAKKILLFSISMGIVVALCLIFAKSIWMVYMLIFLWGFFLYGTVPLSEVWCLENLKATSGLGSFGKIRGIGSVGYGLSGVFIGLLLQYVGWKTYYFYILITVCFTIVAIFIIRDNKSDIRVKVNKEISTKEALAEIIKIKPLMSMVIIIFIYTFVVKGIYSYLGILVLDYGGGPLSLGLTYFFDATPEVVTFVLTVRLLRRFDSKRLVLAAFFLQILRLALILVFNNALSVILLGPLSGFAYGLLAASYKTFIYEQAPEKYKSSCMSLCETIIGLSAVFSAPIFGFVFTWFGGEAAISMGLVIYTISVLVIIRDLYRAKRQEVGVSKLSV